MKDAARLSLKLENAVDRLTTKETERDPSCLQELLKIANDLLADKELGFIVFGQLARLLDDERYCDEVWEYVKSVIKGFEQDDSDLQSALAVSTLVWIPEDPVHWKWVKRLFDLAHEARTKWAVFSAYENLPARFADHFHTLIERKEFEETDSTKHLLQEFESWAHENGFS